MAVNFKLSDESSVDRYDDPMDRELIGYLPTLTPTDVFSRNRGMWFLKRDRIEREQYATFSYAGCIVTVAEITGIETLPWANPRGRCDKQAIVGHALEPGHPAHDHFVGREITNRSRNPVSYIADPPFAPAPELRTCACGCSLTVGESKYFASGHDQRAIHERIARRWGGTLGFVEWFDETHPDP